MRSKLFTLSVAVGALLCLPLSAQEDSGLVNIAIIDVKHDKSLDFETIQAEAARSRKEAGLGPRIVWQVVRGPSQQYHIVTPIENFGQGDTPAETTADTARWLSRVWQCIANRRFITSTLMSDLSIPAKEGRKRNLAVVILRELIPGKAGAYLAYMRDELKPAYEKAGIDGYYVYRNAYGMSGSRSWATVRLVDDWASLDQPSRLAASLGRAKATELQTKGGNMVARVERLVMRYRPDLSWAGEE